MHFNWLTRTLFPDIVKQMEILMATVDQVKEAIAAEKEQVQVKLDELASEIQVLKDVIANGGTVTEEELDSVLEAVNNIFTPAE